jgi:type IV pilus assembly protein PilY1
MWKFDLSDADPANWVVALSGAALYQAKTAANVAQPITTQPIVWPTTATGSLAWLVSFGTGKLYESTDGATTSTQTIYGVLDAGATVASRANLRQQTVTSSAVAGTDAAAAKLFRTLSNNTVCWLGTETGCGGTIHKGYYLDLPDSGERVVYNPSVDGNGGLIYTSYVPPVDTCQAAGYSYVMRFDALTGGRLNGGQQTWDTNGDGVIGGTPATGQTADKLTDGMKVDGLVPGASFVGTGATPSVATAGGATGRPTCWIQTNPTAYLTACDARKVGRVAWREMIR